MKHFLLSLSLITFIGCGSDDTTRTLIDGQCNVNDLSDPDCQAQAFKALGSNPGNNATFSDVQMPIRIIFSQPVNPATVPGNITVTERIGSTIKPISASKLKINYELNNATVRIEPVNASNDEAKFNLNATYVVVVNQGIMSNRNISLEAQMTFTVSTGGGSGTGSGFVSQPGPPKLLGEIEFMANCGVRYAIFRFSESVTIRGYAQACLLGGCAPVTLTPFIVGRTDIYAATIPQEMLGRKFKLSGSDVIDSDGELMENNVDKTSPFNIGLGSCN